MKWVERIKRRDEIKRIEERVIAGLCLKFSMMAKAKDKKHTLADYLSAADSHVKHAATFYLFDECHLNDLGTRAYETAIEHLRSIPKTEQAAAPPPSPA